MVCSHLSNRLQAKSSVFLRTQAPKVRIHLPSEVSGQIMIFHQPRFPQNKGISLPQLPFGAQVMWGCYNLASMSTNPYPTSPHRSKRLLNKPSRTSACTAVNFLFGWTKIQKIIQVQLASTYYMYRHIWYVMYTLHIYCLGMSRSLVHVYIHAVASPKLNSFFKASPSPGRSFNLKSVCFGIF